MKQHCFLLFFLSCLSALHAQQPSAAEQYRTLAWLAGTWNRSNVKPGYTAYERWERSGDILKGYGVTLRGKDTAFVEQLSILVKDDAVYYVAEVKENGEPVHFRMTSISAGGFVCENPEHDFPKKIAYEREGNQLKAVISGNGKQVYYRFEKRKD
jgi:hypothetical protein